eukprot:3377570-Amphidinium_carterae.1
MHDCYLSLPVCAGALPLCLCSLQVQHAARGHHNCVRRLLKIDSVNIYCLRPFAKLGIVEVTFMVSARTLAA